MKSKIVLVPFPFDDLSSQKVRTALCLTNEIPPYDHIVLAFITSHVPATPAKTDLVIEVNDADFAGTGLKVSSTIRLHRLMTITKSIIRRQLGKLSVKHKDEINHLLRNLFDL